MDLGVVGMAVMGRNLAMNAAEKGFKVAVFNRTTSRMEEAVEEAKAQNLTLNGYPLMEDFVKALAVPRKVIVMVQAGKAVEDTLGQLANLMAKDDIIVDGGNEYYVNTERRWNELKAKGIHFMGMGVSGGEEGARHGPSIMPGGDLYAWEHMQPILTKIAAQVAGNSCCKYMGHGAAGHYVKMVHNGIEYGDMELIAEIYNILTNLYGMDAVKCAEVFTEWNTRKLKSYLIEITATVLRTKMQCTNKSLVDLVLDVAAGKGTGKWTVQEAAEKGVPCPTIAAALDARNLSAALSVRRALHAKLGANQGSQKAAAPPLESLEKALYAAKICSYAQGLMLLSKASEVHNFDIDLGKVASIWVGGCIIRADFLAEITKAYNENPKLEHLMLHPYFSDELLAASEAWRTVVNSAQTAGVPVPALAGSLGYFDAFRAAHLPLNLVQAQRDFFGAHTFKMNDREGVFHANWHTGNLKMQ
eukprot:Gregarina_sp_Pseudo_9__5572@NODE_74_length_4574_cov_25_621830_g68_i0_p1_GENE_NODE_74_length_4574_cov_25_621830_g68_i0NODE_74_length_4574_cov_25_621830_g68_i0_p1_ORF_typecomplete_len473_score113_646PGD/PF00393_19/2_5e026PGD/PF00393_19/2_4e101NAD_binding_2/PF03446_15/1_5e37Shikimate_DH/PF01488_20/0_00011Shikimate_DH/PF01488_20/1_1e033HCDH_N/PF02737_18/0_00021IlvN/PF07991_12/0_00078IlvN/PF07991_12/9_3e02adh_short/PF00106_25/0_019adh_short/PF00106_25/99UDPG_MGDP_dh_N/PF03721_14/0_11UDPG_MGDP_dh_N/PF